MADTRPQAETSDDDARGDVQAAPAPSPESTLPRPGALPYLTVADARAAIDWYTQAFDARVVGEPIVMADGRIGHAELAVDGGIIYLAEPFPEMGLVAPRAGAASVSLMLAVDDIDAVLTRARRAGGTVERWTYEGHGRRNATLIDPHGHRWMLAGPLGSPIRQGDIGYASWWTPDVATAREFYGAVLGWHFADGEDEHRVVNLSRTVGLHGGHERSTLFCCYAVEDLAAALVAVRDAGGQPGETVERAEGPVARCTDAFGVEFGLYQPGSGESRPAAAGIVAGDLAYVSVIVPESASARSFYGTVLGWHFDTGNVPDGWQVVGVRPGIGLAGGAGPVAVPTWRVDDMDAALERVRVAGGTVDAGPVTRHFGVSASCLDDQGARFDLLA